MISYAFVIFAGICVALQQVLNARLRMQVGSPWLAGSISYLLGFLAMIVLTFATSGLRLRGIFSGGDSWLTYFGGLFGAAFIGIAILMVPRLGAATTLALIVVGQMAGSLAFDHFGLFGIQQQSFNLVRLAGAACLILGVVLVRA